MKTSPTTVPDLKRQALNSQDVENQFNNALKLFFEQNIEKYVSLKKIKKS